MDRLTEVDDNLGRDEAEDCESFPGLRGPHMPKAARPSWPSLRLSVPMAQHTSEPTGPSTKEPATG
ncbi:hypothetical protein KVR01_009944 [Diaporthe batatas]|uniref:uncharacterized protein n=1 Tax=Diaporthe batatas TaxID=748121 RepID=UPI001D051E6F|nr:uncharacterized protein KVR01_009944 [Diaporthe batatas]KAG8160408.1 hypothetical protein KVR01_009944 [Diaporthe batatas]